MNLYVYIDFYDIFSINNEFSALRLEYTYFFFFYTKETKGETLITTNYRIRKKVKSVLVIVIEITSSVNFTLFMIILKVVQLLPFLFKLR